jgi:hypothetical protein
MNEDLRTEAASVEKFTKAVKRWDGMKTYCKILKSFERILELVVDTLVHEMQLSKQKLSQPQFQDKVKSILGEARSMLMSQEERS